MARDVLGSARTSFRAFKLWAVEDDLRFRPFNFRPHREEDLPEDEDVEDNEAFEAVSDGWRLRSRLKNVDVEDIAASN